MTLRRQWKTTATATTTTTFFLLCHLIAIVFGKSQLCEVESGQTNIILDIEESRGDFVGQRTIPAELPINGDPTTEINLELIFAKGNPTFALNGKTLQLLHPLDRDEENLSHIVFQISCAIRATKRKRNIPIIVRVSDVNDNTPEFINTPYQTSVPESTPVGTTIFQKIQALDKDAGVNGLVEYFLVEGNKNFTDDTLTSADGYGTFSIAFPHQGQVTVIKTLDYEKIQRYYLTIVASDRARNATERLSATTTLIVDVKDSDDLDPSFIYRGCVLLDGACLNPEYTASVPSGSLQGVLSVQPERIQAVDLDTISSPIRYSFLSGTPNNYGEFFEIDEQSGILKQIKVIDTSVAKRYDLIVKAEEMSEAKRFTTAKLSISIKPVDSNPPVIVSSSIEGFVDENSPIGTKVIDKNGHPITLKTTDADLLDDDPKPAYLYELTTPSFVVSKDGYLLVNEKNLDRDPPSPGKFRFQIVSREANSNAASAPLSITVHLKDINDNAPKLPMVPPITFPAGDGRRLVIKVNATDNDAGENAVIKYSIYHVSNNGAAKFTINENTGEIEARGKFSAGEQYSITVQATDIGGLHAQAIVEIKIIPGPNTKAPRFLKPVYDVQVSEGAEINSTVTVVRAEDPENDPVKYMIQSGNDLKQFSIGPDTGVINVIRKLDREELTRYQLIIRAEDNGGLAGSATVNIKVSDINDNNPIFDSVQPYVFEVEEGKTNVFVGRVHATDADDGNNADIVYSIPNDIPFEIDQTSGEIMTTIALDYEKQTEYRFVVTAKDSAPDSRLGTASVTVQVVDIPDELPRFQETRIEAKVPENTPDLLIATVKAIDPDTVKEITYHIRQGPTDLFKIDAKTGQIKSIRGLDYEKDKKHELVIGTMENKGDALGDYMKVYIDVEDMNDIPPVFVSVPEPVTINDDQPVGAMIGAMPAIDGDGSSPGNVVRYEIVGRDKANKYFQVDTETGIIRIREELKNEDNTEFQIDIRAYDLGEPQLSSVATLPVFVRHLLSESAGEMEDWKLTDAGSIVVNPMLRGLAFSDDSYTTSVPETTGINATIKLIQIINSQRATKSNPGFRCEFVSGNELQLFNLKLEENSCGLVILKSLDFEKASTHDLQIQLLSDKYFVNPTKNIANVKVIVLDENDNRPEFLFKQYGGTSNGTNTYYAVVNSEADIDTSVLHVKAIDKDTGVFGTIKYSIFDEENNKLANDNMPSTFFTISEDSGVLKIRKPLDAESFPLHFYVEARDNNGLEQNSNRAVARIVVNRISDENRLALVFSDSSPNDIRNHYIELENLLAEKTNGFIAGIERFSNRKFITDNGSVMENPSATDVWFYLIDPETENIVSRNSSIVAERLLSPNAQSEINFEASGIARATAQGIYGPIVVNDPIQKIKTAIAINDDVFPYALTAIALVILVIGVIGIFYICISWSKYKNFKQRMRQYSAPVNPPRYDPVIVGNTNLDNPAALKEYETQVLAMAVPHDNEDDMHLDYSMKNHAFSLDNVSYIPRKENGGSSPTNSEATTAIVTTLRRNNNTINNINNINNLSSNNRQNTLNRTIEINRNNNPLAQGAISYGTLPGTLTLGRLKSDRNHYQNGYMDTMGRNNLHLAQNNTFNTLGRGTNTFQRNLSNHDNLSVNTLGRHRYGNNEMPIANPLYQRPNDDLSHSSATNENVSFGKREYGQLGYSYLNDLDRNEAETTTEL